MTNDGSKNLIIAVGVITTIVSVYQMVELERAKRESKGKLDTLTASLARIEKKLK